MEDSQRLNWNTLESKPQMKAQKEKLERFAKKTIKLSFACELFGVYQYNHSLKVYKDLTGPKIN